MAGELQALAHISGCVGLHVWACVLTSVRCSRYKPSLFNLSLLFGSPFFVFLSPAPFLSALNTCKASSQCLRQQHSRGTFQLPRRRQIKQGCEGEIPPAPFSFEFVIACCGVAVCRYTLGSMKWEELYCLLRLTRCWADRIQWNLIFFHTNQSSFKALYLELCNNRQRITQKTVWRITATPYLYLCLHPYHWFLFYSLCLLVITHYLLIERKGPLSTTLQISKILSTFSTCLQIIRCHTWFIFAYDGEIHVFLYLFSPSFNAM